MAPSHNDIGYLHDMKIICIGRNYVDHAKELNNPIPSEPLVFIKPSTALLVNSKPLYLPEWTNDVHYEGEIVLKICKNGRYVQPDFADDYYQEIAYGIDFTARDLQQRCKDKGHPWEIAKAWDHSAAVHQWIQKPSGGAIEFATVVNGAKVQSGNTADMIFSFNDIICYVSRYFKLQVGDYIFTGTPAGVGPVQIGDSIEGYIGDKKLLHCDIK